MSKPTAQPLWYVDTPAKYVNKIEPKARLAALLQNALGAAQEDDPLINAPLPDVPEGKTLRVLVSIEG